MADGRLPLVGGVDPGVSCSVDDGGCVTCGDVAVPLAVVSVEAADARCRDAQGREELVAIELVGQVAPGDVLLVHAGVALEHLGRDEGQVGADAIR